MMSSLKYEDAKREEGFTLIELLVVVIIIGILAAIAIPVFLNQRQRAFRAEVQSDLRNLAVEAETYFTDENSYAGFTVPADFGGDTTLTAPTVNGETYCLQGTHNNDGFDEIWRIEPGDGLNEGACGS